MSVAALLYHDVVDSGDYDASGLPGAGAAVYKLGSPEFARHLAVLEERVGQPPARIFELGAQDTAWLLTFDDGGVSALHPTADLLDARGWAGHFFVTAGRIGTRGFLDPAQIRELRARGHVIGSHSWSHPPRMSALSPDRLRDEWTRSLDALAQILGESVVTASVPGGYHSVAVADAAAAAGIQTLFTSEPLTRPRRRAGCLVVGRFTLRRDTTAERAAALAGGNAWPRAGQWLSWNTKKAVKSVSGGLYVRAREAILRQRLPS